MFGSGEHLKSSEDLATVNFSMEGWELKDKEEKMSAVEKELGEKKTELRGQPHPFINIEIKGLPSFGQDPECALLTAFLFNIAKNGRGLVKDITLHGFDCAAYFNRVNVASALPQFVEFLELLRVVSLVTNTQKEIRECYNIFRCSLNPWQLEFVGLEKTQRKRKSPEESASHATKKAEKKEESPAVAPGASPSAAPVEKKHKPAPTPLASSARSMDHSSDPKEEKKELLSAEQLADITEKIEKSTRKELQDEGCIWNPSDDFLRAYLQKDMQTEAALLKLHAVVVGIQKSILKELLRSPEFTVEKLRLNHLKNRMPRYSFINISPSGNNVHQMLLENNRDCFPAGTRFDIRLDFAKTVAELTTHFNQVVAKDPERHRNYFIEISDEFNRQTVKSAVPPPPSPAARPQQQERGISTAELKRQMERNRQIKAKQRKEQEEAAKHLEAEKMQREKEKDLKKQLTPQELLERNFVALSPYLSHSALVLPSAGKFRAAPNGGSITLPAALAPAPGKADGQLNASVVQKGKR